MAGCACGYRGAASGLPVNVVVEPSAEDDIIAAAVWYEQQVVGLGLEFTTSGVIPNGGSVVSSPGVIANKRT